MKATHIEAPITTLPLPKPPALTALQRQQIADAAVLDGIRFEELPISNWAVMVRAKLLRALGGMESLAGFFKGSKLSKSAYVDALLDCRNVGIDALTLLRRMYIASVPIVARPCCD